MPDLKPIIEWLTQFVSWLANPYFLIFLSCLTIGGVLKTIKQIPDWIIPIILGLVGAFAGAWLLGIGIVKGALTGLTLGWAPVGLHQTVNQFQNRNGDNSK